MEALSCFVVIICLSSLHYVHTLSPLVIHSWKYFDYNWDSAQHRDTFIRNGIYNYTHMIPFDVDQSADGRVFITILRYPGVPATLHTVSTKIGESGPLLNPYPDWSWYKKVTDCDRSIVSVYRIAIDQCNKLWVLDNGKIGDMITCPHKLLTFDLSTNKLLQKVTIPYVYTIKSRTEAGALANVIVEYPNQQCRNPKDARVYMADPEWAGIIILKDNRLRRLGGDIFKPEGKKATKFSVEGINFDITDGVVGMALSPITFNTDRYLAFRPLSSYSMYFVNTKDLQRYADEGIRFENEIKYYKAINVLPSQATSGMAFSRKGVLFYGLSKEMAIGCFNIHHSVYLPENYKIAHQDTKKFQFITALKIVRDVLNNRVKEENLLVLTNRIDKIVNQTMNYNEINFRYMKYRAIDVVKRCRLPEFQ